MLRNLFNSGRKAATSRLASFDSRQGVMNATGMSMKGAAAWGAGGAAAGGMLSYATGGGFVQGAMAGALTGGAMAMGGPAAGRAYLGSSRNQSWVQEKAGKSFASGARDFATMTQSKSARRYAYGGGAALGGFMFGGSRNRSRGFNQRRGNRFGR